MTTIRIATDCTLPPARVLRAAYDFGPDRTLVWRGRPRQAPHRPPAQRDHRRRDRRHPRWHRHQLGTMPLRLVPTRPGHRDSDRLQRLRPPWQQLAAHRGGIPAWQPGRDGVAAHLLPQSARALLRHAVPDRRPPDLRPLREAGHRQPRGTRTELISSSDGPSAQTSFEATHLFPKQEPLYRLISVMCDQEPEPSVSAGNCHHFHLVIADWVAGPCQRPQHSRPDVVISQQQGSASCRPGRCRMPASYGWR